MDSNNTASWFLTVIRTQGMRLMRPDKEWRPVVAVEVHDPHHRMGRHDTAAPQEFETLMGVDGQNPNLKHGLYIPGPIPTSPLSSSVSISSMSTSTSTSARTSPASGVRLSIGVWYTPPAQGKKKSKKRTLVGSAELSVGELVKLWQKEREKGRGALDLRLTCHSPTKCAVSSRNGAILTVRLHPPPPPTAPDVPRTEEIAGYALHEHGGGNEEDGAAGPSRDGGRDVNAKVAEEQAPASESDSEATPKPTTPAPAPPTQTLRRRRRHRKRGLGPKFKDEVKGYACSSSSSSCSSDSGCTSETEEAGREERERENERARFIEQWCRPDADLDADGGGGGNESGLWRDGNGNGGGGETHWAVGAVVSVAASLLPQHILHAGPSSGVLENEAAAAWRQQQQQGNDSKATLPAYTERVEVDVVDPDALTLPERVLATFTLYAALRAARVDSEFEAVFARLQMEWGYVGGLLVALAAVNTAVLSISPDTAFTVHAYARGAVAASSVASGLGIACDAWFLLRYGWAEVGVVKTRALDVFGTYFFFALSARTPSFCMFIAALSLMAFLALVAFDAWPGGVLVVCGGVGVVMGLQFLVWGAVWVGRGVRGAGRGVGRVGRGVVGAVGVGRGRGRGNGKSGEKAGC